jgi:hypothetical protein
MQVHLKANVQNRISTSKGIYTCDVVEAIHLSSIAAVSLRFTLLFEAQKAWMLSEIVVIACDTDPSTEHKRIRILFSHINGNWKQTVQN